MPADIWVITDAAGFVHACSPEGLQMLGYSARGAKRRALPNMFVRERPQLSELLRAAQGEVIERYAHFRPNDRKAVRVRFRLTAAERLPDGGVLLLWRFQFRWPVGMRVPAGVDRRQLITIWRTPSLRCMFVPGGAEKRRLIVCSDDDEVIYEEPTPDASAAFARASELRKLAAAGALETPPRADWLRPQRQIDSPSLRRRQE